jgi:Domain of unknown function DUF29
MLDNLYERDILAWSGHQAGLLRRLGRGEQVNDVDWANLAEAPKTWVGLNCTPSKLSDFDPGPSAQASHMAGQQYPQPLAGRGDRVPDRRE